MGDERLLELTEAWGPSGSPRLASYWVLAHVSCWGQNNYLKTVAQMFLNLMETVNPQTNKLNNPQEEETRNSCRGKP